MARTAEQKTADNALEEAIRNAVGAYGLSRGAIVDMIVLYSQTRFDEDGEQYTTVGRLTLGGLPHYRILGLLDFAATAYRGEIAMCEDEEES